MAKPNPLLKIESLAQLQAANRALYAAGYRVYGYPEIEPLNALCAKHWDTPIKSLFVVERTVYYQRDESDTFTFPSTHVNSARHMVAYLTSHGKA